MGGGRGPIHTVSVTKSAKLGRWAGGWAVRWTCSRRRSCHAVDNLRWLAGGEVVSVRSDVRTLYLPGPHANAVSAYVTLDNGVVGLLKLERCLGAAEFRRRSTGRT